MSASRYFMNERPQSPFSKDLKEREVHYSDLSSAVNNLNENSSSKAEEAGRATIVNSSSKLPVVMSALEAISILTTGAGDKQGESFFYLRRRLGAHAYYNPYDLEVLHAIPRDLKDCYIMTK
jgi:hypothetical protein